MGFKSRVAEEPIYFEEKTVTERRRRFCMKRIKPVQGRVGREEGAVCVEYSKGNKTSIHIDNTEAKKITDHFDDVTARLQRLHKSVIWSMFVGRSFIDKKEGSGRPGEETNIELCGEPGFEANNGRSWSRESLTHIESTLKAAEVGHDGLVCLFSVATQPEQPDVDCDEVAWEVEKVLTYHCVLTSAQRLLNPEGGMARRGAEPVSRKVRTPGRNRAGYVVYLAYQLVESVTLGHVMMETVLHGVDIEAKKKHLLHVMGDLRLAPPVDDKVRKVVREVRPFLTRQQVEILEQVTRVNEEEKLSVVSQFLQILSGSQAHKQGGMAGLNQFVSFLSSQQPAEGARVRRTSSQASVARPSLTRSNSARSRKQSSSSFSSCSTTPETPQRCNSASSIRSSGPAAAVRRTTTRPNSGNTRERRRSNLADIQSDGSLSSSSETLLRVVEEASKPEGAPKEKNGVNGIAGASPTPRGVKKVTGSAVNGGRGAVKAGGGKTVEEKRVAESVKASRKVKTGSATSSPRDPPGPAGRGTRMMSAT